MSVAAAQLLWIAGLVGLFALWGRQVARARRSAPPVARAEIAALVGLLLALGVGAAAAWGGAVASDGLDRIEHGAPQAAAPARARLFLRYVQLFLTETPAHELGATVGYSPSAALLLPREYGFDEAARGADLLRIEAAGPRALAIRPLVEPTSTTRILVRPVVRAGDQAGETAARALLRGHRCRAPSDLPDTAPGVVDGNEPLSYAVVLCDGDEPRAALVLERDLAMRDTRPVDTPVRIAPYVWRGDAFRPHHVHLEAGTLLQIGSVGDALPGLTVWEIPAPTGRPGLLFPPKNLLAPCSSWLEGNASPEGGFFYPSLGTLTPSAAEPARGAFSCVLPFTAPFALEVRRLIPDVDGAWTRSLWAGALLVAPCLILLLFLLVQRAAARPSGLVARVVGLAGVSAVAAAVLVVRLLWAQRLDMMRDYEPIGARVVDNELQVVLVAATLAAAAAAVWLRGARATRAVAAAASAWLATAAVGWIAVAPDVRLSASPRLIFMCALALGLGTATALWGPARAAAARAAGRLRFLDEPLRLPLLALVLLAAALLALIRFAPAAVAAKLAAAWSYGPLAYASLRAVLSGTPDKKSSAAVVVLLLLDLGLLLRFDTGVAMIIGGGGLLFALLAVAHDGLFAAADLRLVDAWRRSYRPVVLGTSGAVAAAALALGGWAAAADPSTRFPQELTRAAMHLPLILAVVFGVIAAAILRRARPQARRRAAVWLAFSVLFAGAWAARGPITDRLLGGHNEASKRVAAILDPGYALLADERAFAKGLTAWRETAGPAAGQGYFGAQVLDPGVLLSIENDYLPVLLLRETGAAGVWRLSLLFLALAAALWLVGGGRFAEASAATRARRVIALGLGMLVVYQPVSSLGALPFTGIAWPGLGIDSPSDLWVFLALLLYGFVWGEPAEGEPARHDAELRAGRVWRRVALVAGAAAALLALAGALVVRRVAAFAAARRDPVETIAQGVAEAKVRLVPPFDSLEPVFDWVYRMQCAPGAARDGSVVAPLLGDPAGTPGLARFHAAYEQAFADEAAAARAEVARWAAGDPASCAGARGHWRFERKSNECDARFKFGWPEYRLSFAKEGAKVGGACEVAVSDDVLRSFRYPPRRPYANARVRVVSRALGKAASDRGELVSGQVVVRLRPGAGTVDLGATTAGVFHAERVRLAGDVEVRLADENRVEVRRMSEPAAKTGAALTAPRVLQAARARVHSYESAARWDTRLLDTAGAPMPLDALSVVVTGGSGGRTVWLFRPASRFGGAEAEPVTVDPLLADDVTTVLGSRKRHYVWGGLVPELGWVNPPLPDKSLGLDGWIAAAVSRFERTATGAPGVPSGAADTSARFRGEACGTLAPPDDPTPDAAFARVCAPSPVDHVLECRISIQPELEARLRHVLELTAARPELFTARKGFHPAVTADLALLRGDTGEILAQAHVVPGRESTAYAPATPIMEKLLVDARDNRDPKTGRREPYRGEPGALKADWSQPIAVGSTMKPLLARALERAAPSVTDRMVLTALGKRKGCEPLLGHCPPTITLWNHTEAPADYTLYLGESINWYQAAVGLLGTALPAGELGFGDEHTPVALSFPFAVEANDEAHRLWTRNGGRDVIRADGTIDESALRGTPMWRELELILGRPLCEDGKEACVRAADRRDLCAARALPIDTPSADLRHLVAIGPSTFDFSDTGQARKRQLIKEYLQFLRGSGKHPLASTLQLADAFNRLFFDPTPSGRYRLAATWFPAPTVGAAPLACDKLGESRTVRAGVCRTLSDGTAAKLERTAGMILYGAKTGTVDSLGDVAEQKTACQAWNQAHTIPDSTEQPYHLDCAHPDRNALNDSLLAVAFGVPQKGGTILPLTLIIRYQRSGSAPPSGYAVDAMTPFLDAIADYFAGAPSP